HQAGPPTPACSGLPAVRAGLARVHLAHAAFGSRAEPARPLDGAAGAGRHGLPAAGRRHARWARRIVPVGEPGHAGGGSTARTNPDAGEIPMRRVWPLLILLLAAVATVLVIVAALSRLWDVEATAEWPGQASLEGKEP